MKPIIIGMSKEDFAEESGKEAPDYINGVPVSYDPVNYGVVIGQTKRGNNMLTAFDRYINDEDEDVGFSVVFRIIPDFKGNPKDAADAIYREKFRAELDRQTYSHVERNKDKIIAGILARIQRGKDE